MQVKLYKTTPGTTVTKIWEFEYEITISRFAYDSNNHDHDRKTANINHVKKLTV